ncbi:MAG: TonB-dependent receptor [Rhodothermaceae bacterium]|nr:TonB-dependent receptor [Rhodothermaceae bacterium]
MRLPLLLALLAAAPLAAQPADSSAGRADTTLPDVTVTATRVPLPSRDAPARVTALGRRAVAATNATHVAELLEARAPLFVRRYGPSGLATVTLRGAGSSQTLLLLDGRPLTDPQLGAMDVSLLPTVLLESVEVLHGGGAALYGSDAVGGVVHLRAVQPGEGPALRLTSEAGAWGQRRMGGLLSGRTGRWSGVVVAEGERADEDFQYPDRSLLGEPLVRHAGWDRQRVAGYGAAAYSDEATTLRAAALLVDAERGLGGTDSVGARQWDRQVRLWLDGYQKTGWGRIGAGGFVQRARLRYASPFPAGDRPDALDETGRTATAGLDLRTHVTALDGWHLTGSLSAGLGTADHPSFPDHATDRYSALALAGAQTGGRLRLFPAVRLDAYAPTEAARRLVLSPSLGVNGQPFASDAFRLKASAGRVFRMPTLNDRFWRPGGNLYLQPERGWTVDAGGVWTPRGAQLEVTAFVSTLRDQIVWQPTVEGYWAPENVGRTRSLGVEVSASKTWLLGSGRGLGTGLSATLTDARDRSDPAASSYDRQLRYVPRWTAKGWTSLALGALVLDVNAQAVGRRTTTADASQSLAPYLVFAGQLRYARMVGPVRATLGLHLANLTDRIYEVVQSTVMPPRHLRVRLALQIL